LNYEIHSINNSLCLTASVAVIITAQMNLAYILCFIFSLQLLSDKYAGSYAREGAPKQIQVIINSTRYCWLITSKIGTCLQISVKSLRMKFQENLLRISRVVICGLTERDEQVNSNFSLRMFNKEEREGRNEGQKCLFRRFLQYGEKLTLKSIIGNSSTCIYIYMIELPPDNINGWGFINSINKVWIPTGTAGSPG
jgi:hypothetical protein